MCLGNRKECFSVHSNRGICSAQPAQPTNPSFHGLHNQRNKHDNFWCNKGGDQTLNSRFGPKGTGGASKTDEFSGKLQTAIDPRLIFGKSWQTSRAAYNGPKQQCPRGHKYTCFVHRKPLWFVCTGVLYQCENFGSLLCPKVGEFCSMRDGEFLRQAQANRCYVDIFSFHDELMKIWRVKIFSIKPAWKWVTKLPSNTDLYLCLLYSPLPSLISIHVDVCQSYTPDIWAN